MDAALGRVSSHTDSRAVAPLIAQRASHNEAPPRVLAGSRTRRRKEPTASPSYRIPHALLVTVLGAAWAPAPQIKEIVDLAWAQIW